MRRSSSSLQRLDLSRDRVRREVVQALEVQVDAELARVRLLAQLVLDRECRCGFMLVEHVVEVVGGDLDELAVLELGQRLRRLAA